MNKLIHFSIILLLINTNICAQEARRIVSLAPSITESLYELGAEDYIIGITVFCPKGRTPKLEVGTLWEPDLEKIISLNTDFLLK